MGGVVGILTGEIVRPEVDFYTAPLQISDEISYSIPVLLASEFILFHYVEIRRWRDLISPGSVDRDPIFNEFKLESHSVGYPGGIFDPLGMGNSKIDELKEKELKNGRLSMVAFVGFIAQERVNGLNPIDALMLHLSGPGQHTLFSV